MKLFSVPSDFSKETIDKLDELNYTYGESKIIETYGQATIGTITNSGRVLNTLPKIDMHQLEDYVQYSLKRNIKFNYTLNAACFANKEFSEEGRDEILKLVDTLEGIGVTDYTVTTPPIMELIRENKKNINIKTSAICEIMTPVKTLFYKNLGVKRVVPDPDVTRDFEKLRNIVNVFGDGVEIIVNNMCVRSCAYKMFHYNHEAHSGDGNSSVTDYYYNRCSMQRHCIPRNLMRINWIRPEDLHYYESIGIKNFKIQGRNNVCQGDLAKMVEAYFKEDYDGNLFDLLTIFAPYESFQAYVDNKKLDGYLDAFYRKSSFCKELCEECKYCDKFLEKSTNLEEVKEINEKAQSFYGSYDKYGKFIKGRKREIAIDDIF